MVALTTIVFAVNVATGGGTGLALGAFLAIANLVQAVVFAWLLGRLRPTLWGAGGRDRLASPRDLGYLVGVTVAAAAVSVVIGMTGVWLFTEQSLLLAFADWMARQIAGMFVLSALGLWFGPVVAAIFMRHSSPAGWLRAVDRTLRATPGWRVGEYLAVTVCSVGLYLIGFVFDNGLPLAFPVIIVIVWVAVRLSTGFVVAHSVIFGAATVVFTLVGLGPMATIADPHAQALVAQLFVVIIAVVGLALALGRDERAALMRELATEKEQAARNAAMMTTIFDAMADGVAVINDEGRVVMHNPAAVRLLSHPGAPTVRAKDIRERLRHLDGTPSPTGTCRTSGRWPATGSRSSTWSCSTRASGSRGSSGSPRRRCRPRPAPTAPSCCTTMSPPSGATATSWPASPASWPMTCATR
ncbi:PAS domain-containing protein [Luedemannella flava]